MTVSTCGLDCGECAAHPAQCGGCQSVRGVTFWVPDVNMTVCPLYDCAVNQKRLHHCGECPDLPCSRIRDTRDPAVSQEAHDEEIGRRVLRLRTLAPDLS